MTRLEAAGRTDQAKANLKQTSEKVKDVIKDAKAAADHRPSPPPSGAARSSWGWAGSMAAADCSRIWSQARYRKKPMGFRQLYLAIHR